MRNLF